LLALSISGASLHGSLARESPVSERNTLHFGGIAAPKYVFLVHFLTSVGRSKN
jgi:hypothetical protein